MATVWLHFRGEFDRRQQEQIITGFAAAGVATVPFKDAADGAGIVFFDGQCRDICDFIRATSHRGRERVIAISAVQPQNSWQLLKAGASDVLTWDDQGNNIEEVADRFARWQEVDDLLESSLITDNLVGKSHIWKNTLRQVIEVARFTDASVLVTGESGTGKELVARLVHTLDSRERKRDLIVVDATTIVEGLCGSEFFGHERGAFTGASSARDGAFALADGGTLFLDEIGELPLELQAQLLRVVQERCYKRVGGNSWQKTRFRLVCATNRNLLEEVKKGRFRHDLYYRIAGWECRLPPLRERIEDIIPLARHFIALFDRNVKPPQLDRGVEEYLVGRQYPGNVRDLKLLINRIMYRHVGKGAITIGHIPEDERPPLGTGTSDWCDESFERAIHNAFLFGVGLKEIGRVAEDTAVNIAVTTEEGNLQRAAKRLGVTDRALQLRRAARHNELLQVGQDRTLPTMPFCQ